MEVAPIKPIKKVSRLRNIRSLFKFIKNPIPVLQEEAKTYGDTYIINFGSQRQQAILSIEPEVAQHVLQKNHRNYVKSDLVKVTLAKYIGHGLLTIDGDYWLKQRRLIQPGFHRKKLEKLVGLMHGEIDNFILKFDNYAATEKPFDIYEEMMEVAFRIIAKSIFSTRGELDLNEISDGITEIQEFFVREIRQPYLNWWFKLSGKTKKHLDIADRLNGLILNYITDRKASGERHDDLLDMLLASRYEDTGEGMTNKQLLDECNILFMAGHETTANALSWTWYLLAEHPEILEKLRNEIRLLGKEKPGFDDLPKLGYTRQVIEESMRLYPPAWLTDRIAVEEDIVFGYKVERGDMVMPFIYGIHHSEKYWPEPERFDPDRFSKENKKKHKAYTYFPFGGGPRLCIGNNFAIMEMQLVLARMAGRYDFEVLPGQKIEGLPLITLRPKNGIMMRLRNKELGIEN